MFNFPRWGPIQREVCTGGTPPPGGLQGYNPNSASTGWGQPWNQAFHCPWIQILKHKSNVLFIAHIQILDILNHTFHCAQPKESGVTQARMGSRMPLGRRGKREVIIVCLFNYFRRKKGAEREKGRSTRPTHI